MTQRLRVLERVARGEAPRPIVEPPLPGGIHAHLTGDRLPWDAVVLDQTGEVHAHLEEGGDCLAEAVVPFVGDIVGKLHLGLDVGAAVFEDERFIPLEIGVVDNETVAMGLIDGREHRMTFPDEQPPTGPEQPATTPAQRVMSGNQQRAPTPV